MWWLASFQDLEELREALRLARLSEAEALKESYNKEKLLANIRNMASWGRSPTATPNANSPRHNALPRQNPGHISI
jgi:hypothetical protein